MKEEDVRHDPYCPLRVVYCRDCATAQLDYTVPKETMFGNHTYLSGVTKSLSDHFQTVAIEVDQQFFDNTPGKLVLDIGSNDGTQLTQVSTTGARSILPTTGSQFLNREKLNFTLAHKWGLVSIGRNQSTRLN